MAISKSTRFYGYYQDDQGHPETDVASGKYIVWQSPKGWNLPMLPLDMAAAGFTRVLMDQLPNGSCGLDMTGAPTWRSDFAVPPFVVGAKYTWSFLLTDVAIPVENTSLSDMSIANKPTWLSGVLSDSDDGKRYTVSGQVPAGTSTIPFSLNIIATNARSASKSFIVQPKPLEQVSIYGYIRNLNGYVTHGIGPQAATATDFPFLTRKGPAGFTHTDRHVMETFETGPMDILGGKMGEYQFVEPRPEMPDGAYIDKIEHLGQILFASYTLADGLVTAALTYSATDPSGPPVTPPTDDSFVWAPVATITLQQGQYFYAAVPGSGFSANSAIKTVVAGVDLPSGMSLTLNNNNPAAVRNLEYTVPLGQSVGLIEVPITLTLVDGRSKTNTYRFNIVAVPFFVSVFPLDGKDWVFCSPIPTDEDIQPTMEVVSAPAGWTNPGIKSFERFHTDPLSDNRSYFSRNTDFDFAAVGIFIVRFIREGVTRYATFQGNPDRFITLLLTADAPAPSPTPTYYPVIPAAGIGEGSSDTLYTNRHVDGQPVDTPQSGVEYGTDSPKTGTSISANGFVVVATNSTTGDSYQQPFWAKLNGVKLYDSFFMVNDSSSSATQPTDSTTDQSDQTTVGFFDSVHGAVVNITLASPSNLDEQASSQCSAVATFEDGTTETDGSKFSWALATPTGDFVTSTPSQIAIVAGAAISLTGLLTANYNNVTGDSHPVRVRVSYGGISATQTTQIIDKTPGSSPIIDSIWIRRDTDLNGNIRFGLIVQGIGSYDYKPLTTSLLYDWTGTILPSTGTPTTSQQGTQISVPATLFIAPPQVSVRVSNNSSILQTINIPSTPTNGWIKEYQR